MLTSNALRRNRVDPEKLLEQAPKLRFLMPIRNPVDCAISNQATGLAVTLGLSPQAALTEVLERVVQEMGTFLRLAQRYPQRFFYFFQEDLAEPVLRSLADFLQLDQDPQWLADALHVADIKQGYGVEPSLRIVYERAVAAHVGDAKLAARLRAMVAS